jgi:hypothetical protein
MVLGSALVRANDRLRMKELARLKHHSQVTRRKCMTRITFHGRERRNIRAYGPKVLVLSLCARVIQMHEITTAYSPVRSQAP